MRRRADDFDLHGGFSGSNIAPAAPGRRRRQPRQSPSNLLDNNNGAPTTSSSSTLYAPTTHQPHHHHQDPNSRLLMAPVDDYRSRLTRPPTDPASSSCQVVDICTLTSDATNLEQGGSITVRGGVDISSLPTSSSLSQRHRQAQLRAGDACFEASTTATTTTEATALASTSDLCIENLPPNALVYDIQEEMDAVS